MDNDAKYNKFIEDFLEIKSYKLNFTTIIKIVEIALISGAIFGSGLRAFGYLTKIYWFNIVIGLIVVFIGIVLLASSIFILYGVFLNNYLEKYRRVSGVKKYGFLIILSILNIIIFFVFLSIFNSRLPNFNLKNAKINDHYKLVK